MMLRYNRAALHQLLAAAASTTTNAPLAAVGETRALGVKWPCRPTPPPRLSSVRHHSSAFPPVHQDLQQLRVNGHLSTYLHRGEIKAAARYVRKEMVEHGVTPRSDLLNRLLLNLCSANRASEACRLLILATEHLVGAKKGVDAMLVASFSHVIERSLRPRTLPKALQLYDRAKQLGICLDLPTFNHLLARLGPCKDIGRIDDVMGYMKTQGLEPTDITLTCAIWAAIQMEDYGYVVELVERLDQEKAVSLPMETWLIIFILSKRALRAGAYKGEADKMAMKELYHRSMSMLELLFDEIFARLEEEDGMAYEEMLSGSPSWSSSSSKSLEDEEDGEEDFEEEVEEDVDQEAVQQQQQLIQLAGMAEMVAKEKRLEEEGQASQENEEEELNARTISAFHPSLVNIPGKIMMDLVSREDVERPVLPWGGLLNRFMEQAVVDPTAFVDDDFTEDESMYVVEGEEEEVGQEVRIEVHNMDPAKYRALQQMEDLVSCFTDQLEDGPEFIRAASPVVPTKRGGSSSSPPSSFSSSSSSSNAEGRDQDGAMGAGSFRGRLPDLTTASDDFLAEAVPEMVGHPTYDKMMLHAAIFSKGLSTSSSSSDLPRWQDIFDDVLDSFEKEQSPYRAGASAPVVEEEEEEEEEDEED